MHQNENSTTLNFKEGFAQNYIDALKKEFGGTSRQNYYSVDQPGTKITLNNYSVFPGFEFFVLKALHHRSLIIEREPDDLPDFIHIGLAKEGRVDQSYNNQLQTIEAETANGIFIHNGLFPLISNFAPNVLIRSIIFKVNFESLKTFMSEAIPVFNQMFENNEPKAFHTILMPSLDTLIDDIFNYEKSDFARQPAVMGKGLEIFSVVMRALKKRLSEEQFQGLHIADYQRILKVKNDLLHSVDKNILVDDIAQQYYISRSKLQRDFKALFDCSIYQFFTHAKMDEAYRRLQSGNFSIKEIAYDLGYDTHSSFSKMFKKVKGVNPKNIIPV